MNFVEQNCVLDCSLPNSVIIISKNISYPGRVIRISAIAVAILEGVTIEAREVHIEAFSYIDSHGDFIAERVILEALQVFRKEGDVSSPQLREHLRACF